MVSASDFVLDGIMTPGRVCRIVTPALLRDLKAAATAGQVVDPQVGAWIRAVVQAGEDWAACVDARKADDGADGPSSSPHDLQTVADVAKRLRCTQANVRRLIVAGQLATVRRKPYLIDRAEVDRLIQERRDRAS